MSTPALSEPPTFHLADLICPHCGEMIGNNRHDRDDADQVICQAVPSPWEIDKRFGPKTNAAINVMNMCLAEMGRRLTVAQHSRVMHRIEQTVLVALEEGSPRVTEEPK